MAPRPLGVTPRVSIVIPAFERPERLARAVATALDQTVGDLEVIVVDDASATPLRVVSDDRVRLVRLDRNVGGCAARNVGLAEARGRWVTFLDDDDELLPHMVETALVAIEGASLPAPVAAVTAMEVVDGAGRVREVRIPPTHPRGAHWMLEDAPHGTSHLTKQTLVAPTEVVRSIGGFDAGLNARAQSDLFLRLNPRCSIVGVPLVCARLVRHGEASVSTDPARRQRAFAELVAKHRDVIAAHPRGHARLLRGHARMSWRLGQRGPALLAAARALRLDPRGTAAALAGRGSA